MPTSAISHFGAHPKLSSEHRVLTCNILAYPAVTDGYPVLTVLYAK